MSKLARFSQSSSWWVPAQSISAHAVELVHRQGLKVTALASAGDGEILVTRGADHVLSRGASLAPAGWDGMLDAAVPGPIHFEDAAAADARLAEGGLRGRLVLIP
ncbi:hypothetical protein [Saccharopolyspora oryzae]|uniref:Zinc-binding alcohol dehydrogenase family protein n=1 Tax=Saccharopolyspora oryzae TaxID=2997343 RepID=A0ABT4V5N1_9PSEU|nr:hypothetical protein [Saccharopolyspora oryzae]MDA3629133.1 hypothetical protein [Saccharopolyspora oryzae]